MNDQSRMTDQKPASERQQWNKGNEPTQEAGKGGDATQNEASLWDDPDLVPVPVLPSFSDNSLTYEVQENAGGKDGVHRVMPPSAHGN